MDWTMENIHTEVPLEVYLKFSSVSISAFTGSSRGDVGTFKNIKTTLETSLCTSVLFCSSSSLASSSALNTFASQPQSRSPMVKPDA